MKTLKLLFLLLLPISAMADGSVPECLKNLGTIKEDLMSAVGITDTDSKETAALRISIKKNQVLDIFGDAIKKECLDKPEYSKAFTEYLDNQREFLIYLDLPSGETAEVYIAKESLMPFLGDRYYIVQCRIKNGKIVNNVNFSPGFNPNIESTLNCADSFNNGPMLEKCFTPCQAEKVSRPGILNEIIKDVIPDFCTGYSQWASHDPRNNVYFFSEKKVTLLPMGATKTTGIPKRLIQQQVDNIKQKITDNADIIRDSCKDPNRPWVLYILKVESDGLYKLVDYITLSN